MVPLAPSPALRCTAIVSINFCNFPQTSSFILAYRFLDELFAGIVSLPQYSPLRCTHCSLRILMSTINFMPFDYSNYSEVVPFAHPWQWRPKKVLWHPMWLLSDISRQSRSPSLAPRSASPAPPARLPSPAASSVDVLVVVDSPSPQRAPSPVPFVGKPLRLFCVYLG